MDTPVNPADQALAQLRQDFQGHRIWRATRYDGKLGDWVATLHDPKAGVEPTIEVISGIMNRTTRLSVA